MSQDELDEILANASKYRERIEKQLIDNEEPNQALEYHAVALAYPWNSLHHPDYPPKTGSSNEDRIPFIYYGFLNKRMAELGYQYKETTDHRLFDRKFIFNRIKG